MTNFHCRMTFFAGLWMLATVASGAEQQPRNVLFIVCDDLNTHVSTSGYDDIQTPTLSTFANDAMSFSHAFCQYPVCGPSRASFLYGLYPESTGVVDNRSDIRQTRPGTISMPRFFGKNGYWTGGVGKVFHSPRDQHEDTAWDEYHWFDNDELPIVAEAQMKFEAEFGSIGKGGNRGNWNKAKRTAIAPLNAQTPPGHGPSGLQDEQHRDGKNARQVAKWLREKSFGDKPFFITVGIQKPHVPFLAPDKYFDLYPQQKIQFHRDPANLWDTIPRDALQGRFREFGFELGQENEPRRREFMQAYHACVSFIDAQIGIVLKQLEDSGLQDNTIVVLTSDHGYHLGDHFLWGKVTLFDIGAKVPFIVRVPGMTTPGSRSDAMIELVDIFPTLTELTQCNGPSHLQGTSIVPLLRDPTATHAKEYAYSVVSRGECLGYAVRNQQWRYGKWPSGEELYDLSNDPNERHNLANEPARETKLKELRRVLTEKKATAANAR